MPNQEQKISTNTFESENGTEHTGASWPAPLEVSAPNDTAELPPGAVDPNADAKPPIYVDVTGGETIDLAALGFDDAVPQKIGDDLMLTRADGSQVVLAEFFVAAETDSALDLLLENGLPVLSRTPGIPRVQHSKVQIVWSTRSSTTIELPLLDLGESQQLCEQVMSLSANFQIHPPSPLGNLKTLGLASYLDVTNSEKRAKYLREAGESNALLLDKFGKLYRQIVQAVTEATGQRTFLTSRYAVPGFHVFDPFTYSKAGLKRPHFDTQYALLDPNYRLTPDNTQHHLTITLLIAEPPGGAFVEYYDFDLRDHLLRDTGARGTISKSARSKKPTLLGKTHSRKTHRYSIGKLVLTIGLPLHQIWLLKNESEPGLRVSLQGHGVMHKDGWELFW